MSDSDEGEAADNYIHEHMDICRAVTPTSGASKNAKVHLLALEEDGKSSMLSTWCDTRLNRFTAITETTDKFHFEDHQPCRKCQKT